MSSTGEGSRDWRFYVTDMIEFADKVRAYTSKTERGTLLNYENNWVSPFIPKAIRGIQG